MRKLLRLVLFNLALLGVLLALVWVTQRSDSLREPDPTDSPESAAQVETPAESVQPETEPLPSPPAPTAPTAGATEMPTAASPTTVPDIGAVEPTPSDLILDPGDPLYNDAPTQTLSLPALITEVANIRHAHLTFEFVFNNDGPGEVTSLDLYVSIPQSRDNQRITKLEFSAPYTLTVDRYDEQMGHFRFTDLAAGQDVRVTWEGDIEIEAKNYDLDPEKVTGLDTIPPELLETYTTDEEKYRLDSSVMQQAARAAGRGAATPYWIARNVHDFVARRLSYSNDGQWDDAETVYLRRSGSCSEYSFLFVALSRANGLPARYVAGTRQRKEGVYEDILFHRWAEVYLPPYGWVPVDVLHDDRMGGPQYDYFGGISDERFATTVSGGDSEYLGWNYHYGYRFDYGEERPEVSRARRFVWEPYPSELRAIPEMLSGFALPGMVDAHVGKLGIVTTNGAYDWSVRSSSSWLRPDREAGSTPDAVWIVADTRGLGLGLYRGEVILESRPLGRSVIVPVELNVVDEIPGASPEGSGP
jgi:transglutaminase-like putative cysteine protease